MKRMKDDENNFIWVNQKGELRHRAWYLASLPPTEFVDAGYVRLTRWARNESHKPSGKRGVHRRSELRGRSRWVAWGEVKSCDQIMISSLEVPCTWTGVCGLQYWWFFRTQATQQDWRQSIVSASCPQPKIRISPFKFVLFCEIFGDLQSVFAQWCREEEAVLRHDLFFEVTIHTLPHLKYIMLVSVRSSLPYWRAQMTLLFWAGNLRFRVSYFGVAEADIKKWR